MRRIILFPGLAADERMYAQYSGLPIPLVTPRLLIPESGETMVEYARRHAEWLGIDAGDIVGGCSFGSMVASEICRQRNTKGLILLSGALSSKSLVANSKWLHTVSQLLPVCIVRRVLTSSFFLRKVFGEATPSDIQFGRLMIEESATQLLVRGSCLAVNYESDRPITCPVFSLHGGQDRVIRAPDCNTELLEDAGHGMVISHHDDVTRFLSKVCVLLNVGRH